MDPICASLLHAMITLDFCARDLTSVRLSSGGVCYREFRRTREATYILGLHSSVGSSVSNVSMNALALCIYMYIGF